MASGALRLARDTARAGAGQPRRAPARPLRLAAYARGAARARARERGCARRRRRCARCASSSRRRTDEGFAAWSGAVRARRSRGVRASSSRPPARALSGKALEEADPSGVLLVSTGAGGTRTTWPRSPRARSRRLRPGRDRNLPAPAAARRPAGAARRCPGSRSRSRARTASTRALVSRRNERSARTLANTHRPIVGL